MRVIHLGLPGGGGKLVIINLDWVRLDILRLWLDRRWGGVILLDWGRLVAKILHRGRLVIIILDWAKLVIMRLDRAVVDSPAACGEVAELVRPCGGNNSSVLSSCSTSLHFCPWQTQFSLLGKVGSFFLPKCKAWQIKACST